MTTENTPNAPTETPNAPSTPAAPVVDINAIKASITEELKSQMANQYDEKLKAVVSQLDERNKKAAAVLSGVPQEPTPSAFAQALSANPEQAMVTLLSSFENELEKKILSRQSETEINKTQVNAAFAEIADDYDIPQNLLKYFQPLMEKHFVKAGKPIKDAAKDALLEIVSDYKLEKKIKQAAPTAPALGNGLFSSSRNPSSVADYIKASNDKLRKTRKLK